MASHQQPPRSHLTLNHLNSQSSTNLFSAGSGSANSHTHIPGTGSSTSSCPTSPSTDMFHRPPALRSTSSSLAPSPRLSSSTPRGSPLLPSASPNLALGAGAPLGSIGAGGYPAEKLSPTPSPLGGLESPLLKHPQHHPQMLQPPPPHQPSICGMPLKYVSLVTLAVQNAALSIVMHYSRVSIPPSLAYSPASAVLLNELLKGSISFIIAFCRSPHFSANPPYTPHPLTRKTRPSASSNSIFAFPITCYLAFVQLCSEIFSPDAWKLSIPAILYVVQNSLQFVAISNLPVASFQVTYQMKILTTAAFSVVLLRKKLTGVKWLALLFLAVGVGIVQIQTSTGSSVGRSTGVGSAHEFHHVMSPLKGFGAVTAACFTSGLAGVYFEMVLKGSKADLWVRNVQLSLFSLIPALLPILYAPTPPGYEHRSFLDIHLRHFGFWAWATVGIQVFGGLVTAVVIKYSDNILKGFATSLSIVLSFLASVALFDFRISGSFVLGAGVVLCATWMYNQPAKAAVGVVGHAPPVAAEKEREKEELEWERERERESFSLVLNNASPTSSGKSSPSPSPYYPGTPSLPGSNLSASDSSANGGSVLGLGVGSFMRRKSSGMGIASAAGFGSASRNSSTASLSGLLSASLSSVSNSVSGGAAQGAPRGVLGLAESGELVHAEGAIAMDTTPWSSRPPSRMPSRVPSRAGSPAPGGGPKFGMTPITRTSGGEGWRES